MTNRKHSVWAWIAYPLLAVVLYVLSIGPAFAAAVKNAHPDRQWIAEAFHFVYAPVISVCERAPRPVKEAVEWYLELWL